jgi:hypothetical protein
MAVSFFGFIVPNDTLLCSTQIANITRSCEYCNYIFVLQDVKGHVFIDFTK